MGETGVHVFIVGCPVAPQGVEASPFAPLHQGGEGMGERQELERRPSPPNPSPASGSRAELRAQSPESYNRDVHP
jgi:hypothetical protein